MKIKKAGIIYNPLVEAAREKAREVKRYLDSVHVTNWMHSSWELAQFPADMPGTDLLVSIGGDGTILRGVQVAASTGTPILGINLGKLGFMTELSAGESLEKLPEVLNGAGWLDERTMLETKVAGGDKIYYALNDVVMARGAIARVVAVEVKIDGEPFTSYRADGVIISTATGSTGYALAAGGPILSPQAPEMVLLPILPHLSLPYPLVLPGDAVVNLAVCTSYPGTLSIDGNINLPIEDAALVEVKRSQIKARFWRVHPKISFYRMLEQKLRGNK